MCGTGRGSAPARAGMRHNMIVPYGAYAFAVGMVIQHPIGRTVTAADNAWFTLITVNTNPIHFDAHYAAQTEFGRPLVNSALTLALITGLSVADVSQYGVNLGW